MKIQPLKGKQSLHRRVTVALAAFAFAFAFGASAAPRDLIVCAGGVYCYYDVLETCRESGQDEYYCQMLWRGCVLDACPQ